VEREPFARFRAFSTLHCVTGSMRHLYDMCGQDVGEELLLGLGAGVSFIYWHQKGAPPILGGRGNVGRPGHEGFEIIAGRRTGVAVTFRMTKSARRARAELLADLTTGTPSMLQVDMGFLPYFDFGAEYHFGGHVVAVVGYDEEHDIALVCDRDEPLHPVALDVLERARSSEFQPFPPRHGHWTFDFTHQRAARPGEVLTAITEATNAMLSPPIRNLGVAGIRKAADLIPAWPERLEPGELKAACRNGFILIDATGGTGGGLFRYMYGRFLEQAADITGEARLGAVAAAFQEVGDRWQDAAVLFQDAADQDDPAAALRQVGATLRSIADLEETTWTRLADVVAGP
jgi:Domain of unknown function (DUF4872)/Butirosin biosynthesis protein H, N-terminal